MRLICPNCGAQYAVDDRVIPEAGRDVQCSNCGNTWFQKHPDLDTDLAEELTWEPPRSAPPQRPASEPPSEEVTDPASAEAIDEAPGDAAPADTEIRGETADSMEPQEAVEAPAPPTDDDAPVGPHGGTEEAATDEPRRSGPTRQQVDASVLAVLREEAKREQAARKIDSGVPEVQPDLGVPTPEAAPHRGTADYTVAPSRSGGATQSTGDATADEALERAIRAAPRRGRLPDVEQINSTLEPSEEEAAALTDDYWTIRRRRQGMRIGLGLAFLAFGLAALVYARSERIAAAVPETAEPLADYVASIDSGRLWLDRRLRGALPTDSAPATDDN